MKDFKAVFEDSKVAATAKREADRKADQEKRDEAKRLLELQVKPVRDIVDGVILAAREQFDPKTLRIDTDSIGALEDSSGNTIWRRDVRFVVNGHHYIQDVITFGLSKASRVTAREVKLSGARNQSEQIFNCLAAELTVEMVEGAIERAITKAGAAAN